MYYATMVGYAPLLFAQADHAPRRVSFLFWMLQSLGIFYSVILPLAGIAVFVGAVVVVLMARRPSVIAAYLPLVALPLLIGMWATVEGAIRGWSVVQYSTTPPQVQEVASLISSALATTAVGMFVSGPSYLVVAIGLFVRAILWRPPHDTLPPK